MTSFSWIWKLCLLSWISMFVSCLLRMIFNPLRDIPGPALARFTKLWYFFQAFESDFRWLNVHLHRKYGSVVRIAPNEYSIDHPEVAKQIYAIDNKFLKADWYDFWKNPDPKAFQDLFSIIDPRQHAINKKAIKNLYSMTNLMQMETCIDEILTILVRKLDEFVRTEQAIDLVEWLRRYSFDAIMYITLNKRFGIIEGGDDKGMLSRMQQHARLSGQMGRYPVFWAILVRILIILRNPNPLETVVDFSEQQVDEFNRRFVDSEGSSEKQSEQRSMLHQAFVLHTQVPELVPRSTLVTVAVMNVIAGSDTTSIALASAIHFLTTNKECLEKLREELCAARKSAKIPSGSNTSFHTLQKLKYLQAVIKESMRLHTPIGMPMPRVVPEPGCYLAGYHFPAGSVVGINPWVAHRNITAFGEDADKFRPERWLIDDKEMLSSMDRYLLTWGHGNRKCTGQAIGLLGMSKLLAVVVLRYDFQFLNDQIQADKQRLNVQSSGGWFVLQTNLQVRLRASHLE